jgi:hypothetical protein
MRALGGRVNKIRSAERSSKVERRAGKGDGRGRFQLPFGLIPFHVRSWVACVEEAEYLGFDPTRMWNFRRVRSVFSSDVK